MILNIGESLVLTCWHILTLTKLFFLGSTVATSLIEGEAIPKKIGILKIYKNQFKMIPIELKTVRPFICADMVLKTIDEMVDDDTDMPNIPTERTREMVRNKLKEMIVQAKSLGKYLFA